MSKTIVEKHLQGKIWIENRAEGVTFKISLPLVIVEKEDNKNG